jgi:hypothetical protein
MRVKTHSHKRIAVLRYVKLKNPTGYELALYDFRVIRASIDQGLIEFRRSRWQLTKRGRGLLFEFDNTPIERLATWRWKKAQEEEKEL